MTSRFDECRLVAIPGFADQRGRLSVIDGPPLLPFQPKRFYYLYEIPTDAHRGCHAHKTEQEFMVALVGSFYVSVTDGDSSREFELKSPDRGLYVPPLVWHELHSFAPGSVCAVLASEPYNPGACYYVYDEFLNALK
jgi:dTDP-4-dehydrorhamnose 3,5-epimerase-like enzyme